MNINKIISDLFNSHVLKIVLYIAGGLVIALIIFQAGVFIGTRKANFSLQWGDNYHRNFGGPREGFLQDFQASEFIGGHGTAGTIVRIEDNKIIVKGSDNVEKIISLDASTVIRQGMKTIVLKDIKTDDKVVILGTPQNDGSILAKMIRLFSPEDRFQMPPPMFGPPKIMPFFRK